MSTLALLLALAVAGPASDILHYTRSNRDGSEPEHVVQYRPSRTGISVYKWVEKCSTAAYVTAEMDEAVHQPLRFTAGKVGKSGEQVAFGTLRVSEDGTFRAEVSPPGSGMTIRDEMRAGTLPAYLYDFDFSDLNAALQQSRPESDFTFSLPVIWPGEGPKMFRDLGRVEAKFAGEEERLGRSTRRFDLVVDGPTAATGTLWLDSAKGFIVEAELGLPNHAQYRDFRLKLDSVEPGSSAAWEALTRSHHESCQTGN